MCPPEISEGKEHQNSICSKMYVPNSPLTGGPFRMQMLFLQITFTSQLRKHRGSSSPVSCIPGGHIPFAQSTRHQTQVHGSFTPWIISPALGICLSSLPLFGQCLWTPCLPSDSTSPTLHFGKSESLRKRPSPGQTCPSESLNPGQPQEGILPWGLGRWMIYRVDGLFANTHLFYSGNVQDGFGEFEIKLQVV